MNLDNVANSCEETRRNEYSMEKKSRDTTRNVYMKTFFEYIILVTAFHKILVEPTLWKTKKHIAVGVENGMIDIIYFVT